MLHSTTLQALLTPTQLGQLPLFFALLVAVELLGNLSNRQWLSYTSHCESMRRRGEKGEQKDIQYGCENTYKNTHSLYIVCSFTTHAHGSRSHDSVRLWFERMVRMGRFILGLSSGKWLPNHAWDGLSKLKYEGDRRRRLGAGRIYDGKTLATLQRRGTMYWPWWCTDGWT